MSWTAERLDALPEFTGIECGHRKSLWTLTRGPGGYGYDWIDNEGNWVDSDEVLGLAEPGSIRVVSVPIDALLAAVGPASRAIIRGAIDTVTREAS